MGIKEIWIWKEREKNEGPKRKGTRRKRKIPKLRGTERSEDMRNKN